MAAVRMHNVCKECGRPPQGDALEEGDSTLRRIRESSITKMSTRTSSSSFLFSFCRLSYHWFLLQKYFFSVAQFLWRLCNNSQMSLFTVATLAPRSSVLTYKWSRNIHKVTFLAFPTSLTLVMTAIGARFELPTASSTNRDQIWFFSSLEIS